MGLTRKILMGLLALALIVLIIVTWGSVASIVFTFALVMIVPVYLFNRFVNTDENSDFVDDQNN